MNSNHFIISYRGNKRKEMKDIFQIVDPYLNNKKMIVEPFCGTAAFSYYISLKYPKRFKYVLNDCNENLIKLYHVLKNDEETKRIINEAKELNENMDKEKYSTLYKTMNESVVNYFYCHLIYTIKPGLYPLDGRDKSRNFDDLLKRGIINFLRTEDVEINCDHGNNVVEKYKNNKEAVIFLDPPYLMSCNSFYDMGTVESKKLNNIYQYIVLNPINNYNAYTCLVLEKNWIIELLFKNDGNIKAEIGKKYQGSKKQTTHLIIDNQL